MSAGGAGVAAGGAAVTVGGAGISGAWVASIGAGFAAAVGAGVAAAVGAGVAAARGLAVGTGGPVMPCEGASAGQVLARGPIFEAMVVGSESDRQIDEY